MLTNPTDIANAIRLSTPATTIECQSFPFGRIDLDEAAGTVRIDAAGAPVALNVTGTAATKLIVNGQPSPLS